jgi:hypothetical protein
MPRPVTDIAGKTFGRLLVIGRAGSVDRLGYVCWKCVCECGTMKVVSGKTLRSGAVRSCGCLQREHFALDGCQIRHSRMP